MNIKVVRQWFQLVLIMFITLIGQGKIIMAKDVEVKANDAQFKKAVLAGGCFWSVEKLFSKLDGVHDVVNGYTGGTLKDPTYEALQTGTTGHAEVVEVTYDSNIISYENILKFFFKIHDPTTLNKQQNDIGPQYRSAIFYANPQQKNTAYNVIALGNQSGVFKKPIVTQIEKLNHFYRAEEYHQDYLKKNPYGYNCHKIHDEWTF